MKSKERIKKTGEVFTPPELVEKLLDRLPADCWEDSTETWLDPTCGNGAFLICVKNRLLEHHPLDHILNNMLFGVDFMEDNIKECISALYGEGLVKKVFDKDILGSHDRDGFISMFTHNGKLVKHIIQADGLEYDYNFDERQHADSFISKWPEKPKKTKKQKKSKTDDLADRNHADNIFRDQ